MANTRVVRRVVPRVDSPGMGLGLPLIAQSANLFGDRRSLDPSGVVLRVRFELGGTPRDARVSSD